MNPEELKPAWRGEASRTRLAVDAAGLIDEVERDRRQFASTIFWRDAREIGVGLAASAWWVYRGVTRAMPWSWYLAVPAMLWIAGYMLADRWRHAPRPAGSGEPLRRHVELSLAEVERQVRLLRGVLWWYLAPLAVAYFAFIGESTWRDRGGGWPMVLAASLAVAIGGGVFAAVYWLNQHAVRDSLEPRRRELEAILQGLGDEPPAPDAS